MQNNWPIIGHEKIVDFLRSSIKNNKIAHAYLFYGPDKIGKFKTAIEFAKTLECKNRGLIDEYIPCNKCKSCVSIEKSNFPDVLILKAQEIKKDKKTYEKKIGIEEIQEVQHYLSLYSHSAPYKIIIVDGAEKLSREASNSFLKTLEDPSDKSIIILLADSINSILPTIISRTQAIKFLPVSKNKMIDGVKSLKSNSKETAFQIEEAANYSLGKPGMLIDIINNPESYIEINNSIEEISKIIKSDINVRYEYASNLSKDSINAKIVLENWILFFRDLLLIKKNCKAHIIFRGKEKLLKKNSVRYSSIQLKTLTKKCENARKLISNSSFNTRLILENLFLKT